MKRVVVLMGLLICLAGCSSAKIQGRGPEGMALVSRLQRLVPKPFLVTDVPMSVEASTPMQMLDVVGSPSVLAYYELKTREIHVRSDLQGYIRDYAVVHEYGHFVYYHMLSINEREAWAALWSSESFRPTQYRSVSVEEGFAEAFAVYVMSETTVARGVEGSFVWGVQQRIRRWRATL